MKICFIMEKISTVGGVQRVVLTLANELSKFHEVTIISIMDTKAQFDSIYEVSETIKVDLNKDLMKSPFFSKAIRSFIKISNKKIGILNNKYLYQILEKSFYPREIKRKFIQYINENDYDVVIGVEGFCSFLLATISDDISCKKIGWQHNSYEAYLQNKGRYYWNQDQLFMNNIPKLNEYIVLTNHDRDMFKKFFDIDCTVIYNPLSFSSNQKSNLKNKKIISLGRFTAQKGFDNLIKSFSLINSKYNQWTLEIYGEGEDENLLQQLIRENNLQKQVQLKPITKNVAQVLCNASIYAMSSRWEGFGLVVTEALECGLPVVAFNTTGPSEILSNANCGILVEGQNIDDFAKALEVIMSDYEYRKQLSTNSIERANAFNVESIAQLWINIMSK